MNVNLDDWQKEVLKTKGNLCLRSGRQVGKSTVVAMKAAKYAVQNHDKTIMVISAVERQSFLLFEKILGYLTDNYKQYIKKGKDRPTKHIINLKNGSRIYSLPTGLSGYGIRGYTVDLLIADEAAYIPEDVWTAVTPMLAMTGGDLWLLSTPKGREGFFFECFNDDTFTKFHISTEEVLGFENRTERQKRDLQKRLDIEKDRMSAVAYAQEYLGEFADELKQVFPDVLLRKVCVLKRRPEIIKRDRRYFLGVDVAGLGGDAITLEAFDRINDKNIEQVENIVTRKQLTTQTYEDIVNLNSHYRFAKIGVDDGGVGFGVWSELMTNDSTKFKTVALNNASRPITRDGTKTKHLLKIEMYMNALAMMESGKVKLLDDNEIFHSLKSMQFEYVKSQGVEESKLVIHGRDSHIAEGIIRALWLIAENKDLNIFVHTF